MTTEIANYDEMLAALAKKATKTEKPSSSSIGVRAGVLSYNGTPVPGNKLGAIIIASTHANLLYEGKYDPNNLSNPVCYAYSEDPDEIELKPHPKSSKPQSDKCETCPMNQWGSDPDGGRGKACKNTRRLALVPDGVTPEDLATAEVATLSLPVMSVKNWGNYVNKLATLFGMPPLALKTVVSTQPDQKSQFKITFDDAGPVDKSLIPGLLAKVQTAQQMLEREYEANPEADEEAAEKKPAKKAKF
jgi:hypothetical protein